jgi:phage-related baseplate assembly protein
MSFSMKTFSQIRDSMINWAAANQSEVTDFNEGGVLRTLIEAFSSELAEIYFRIFDSIDDAQREAVYTAFDFPRKAATSAAGTVLLQRTTLSGSNISISSGTQVAVPASAAAGEVTFTSSANYTLPQSTTLATAITTTGQLSADFTSSSNVGIGDILLCQSEKLKVTNVVGATVFFTRGYGGTTAATHILGTAIGVVGKAVIVTADVTGAAGNVAGGTISKISTSIAGIATVTNEAAFTGGADEETEDARKKRFVEFVSGLARGTKAAIQFGAKQVTNVVSAVCIDNEDDGSIAPGFATLYIADASGGADATLLAAVVAEEVNWRPAGLALTVAAPAIVSVSVTATLTLAAGYDPTTVKTAVTQTITDHITSLKMGDDVLFAILIQKIVDTNPTAILNVNLTLPAADTAITPGQIARPGTITLTTV